MAKKATKGRDEQALEDAAAALGRCATALRDLGTGNAATQMGAIEYLAKEVREGSERIAEGLHAIAAAIESRGG